LTTGFFGILRKELLRGQKAANFVGLVGFGWRKARPARNTLPVQTTGEFPTSRHNRQMAALVLFSRSVLIILTRPRSWSNCSERDFVASLSQVFV
jgi:hypothetical protein